MTGDETRARRRRVDPTQQREQVLAVFSTRAKRDGIRSVMMGELATELRMSASTLYKLFPSKEALTLACVDRWAKEVAASEASTPDPKNGRDEFERFMHWLDAWADANAELSPAFTRDLKSDYPEAFARYRDVIRSARQQGAALLRPALKPEVDERVALAVLRTLLDQTIQPEFADKLRISRHEAMRSAVTIWASGAMQRRGKLRKIDAWKRQTDSEEAT
ncbi:MAG: TetR/AcrR family transcriptional regulator [Myxococcales bacterium]|nr:TetR/AcrR family transcriptional regulator [Myxococcales bacterium]